MLHLISDKNRNKIEPRIKIVIFIKYINDKFIL